MLAKKYVDGIFLDNLNTGPERKKKKCLCSMAGDQASKQYYITQKEERGCCKHRYVNAT